MDPPKEYKLQALREYPMPSQLVDEPGKVADYYNATIKTDERFNPEIECFHILIVNTRRRVKGHVLISTGTMDTCLVHPREVFRPAIAASASAIILTHNHPSGDPSPSEADVRVTRDLIRAGQLLKIEVLDHIIIGAPSPDRVRSYLSLLECGYLA